MGFTDECFSETADEMIDSALDSSNAWLSGIDRSRLETDKYIRLNFAATGSVSDSEPFLPFANGAFATTSGKAELYSEALKQQGLDPVVGFTPPSESRNGGDARAFPLELLARKADNFLNSTFSNVPAVQLMEADQTDVLEINTIDATARGITDGAMVRVFNRRGELRLKARVDGRVQAGVVSSRLQWAKLTPGSKNINVLTSEKLTDLGNSATFYSVLVEVELFQPRCDGGDTRRNLDARDSSTV
jgi:anaerobic selenocysteine-containing dehydrogenase